MDAWVLWVIAAVALAVGEMLTMGFFLAPFAIGAVGAAGADLAGASIAIDLVIFLVISLVVLTLVRPLARQARRIPPQIRTGTAALVGKTAVVVQRIEGAYQPGSVKIDGEVWTARGYDEDDVLEQGARVRVIEIRGATALVSE